MSESKTKKSDSSEKKSDSSRRAVWEIQSRITHDGKKVFTEEMIKRYIARHEDTLKWYAWIVHDKDVYTEEDKLNASLERDEIKVGSKKPTHIHLILQFKTAKWRSALAKEFGLPEIYVRRPVMNSRKLQIPAMVTYLTHVNEGRKYSYSPEKIQSKTPDKIQPMIEKYLEAHKKEEIPSKKARRIIAEQLVEELARGETTIPVIKESWGLNFYLDFEQRFQKARQEYMKVSFELKPRINYYIEGKSGVGKSTVARMLAKTLGRDVFVEQLNGTTQNPHAYKDDELYLEVGEKKVRFDAYEYQPILIWNDIRYDELLGEFNREGVLNLLELIPSKRNYNIKYGGVILANQVNIFNGIEDSTTFISGLTKTYKDSSGIEHEGEPVEQAYRRFPVVIHVHDEYIEIKIRHELAKQLAELSEEEDSSEEVDTADADAGEDTKDSTAEDTQYQVYKVVRVNIREINRKYGGEAWEMIAKKIMHPIVELHEKYMILFESGGKITSSDSIPEIEILDQKEALRFVEESKKEG